MALSAANKRLMGEFLDAAPEVKMEMEDKKKKKKKSGQPKGRNSSPTQNPGADIHKAKALKTSKASRGFTTKKPPAAYLSYPL